MSTTRKPRDQTEFHLSQLRSLIHLNGRSYLQKTLLRNLFLRFCTLRAKFLWSEFLQIVSRFCMFSLKIVGLFVRRSFLVILAEEMFANGVVNLKNKFQKMFFWECFFPFKVAESHYFNVVNYLSVRKEILHLR